MGLILPSAADTGDTTCGIGGDQAHASCRKNFLARE
jgi:hypothetical protein